MHLRYDFAALVLFVPSLELAGPFNIVELDPLDQVLVLGMWPGVSEVFVDQLPIGLELRFQALGDGLREFREELLHFLGLHKEVAPFDLVVEEGLGQVGKLRIQLVDGLNVDELGQLLPDLELLDPGLPHELLQVV